AGTVAALKVPMTGMPGMVAILNGCGGLASALVALAYLWVHVVEPAKIGTLAALLGFSQSSTLALSILLGGLTFSGSVVAYLKVQEKVSDLPVLFAGRHLVNTALFAGSLAAGASLAYVAISPSLGALLSLVLLAVSLILGVLMVIPIGGADMPVVISLLNALSGVAASATGFIFNNDLLIIAGALVGASGLILTQIMCTAMNRSLANVVFGGFGAQEGTAGAARSEYKNVRFASAEDAAVLLEIANSVVIVPGYGMAVAQAQHIVHELSDLLQSRGAKVHYAIHPVAGRMPGHMNVLLAEANVPYDQLIEMEAINPEFKDTDVVIVIGANDVVNPAGLKNPGSPIYGMPILEVFHARSVFVVKRSLGAGFAGIKNELFEYPNTMMLLGNARQVVQEILGYLKSVRSLGKVG
ncbi:MAG: NAD(P)(+) transhydrogenase (Re/Si-specific) subunit beta, partial [Planctomycetes bacterium]|nr:NAD(P)(+) transhydrogenase (Re/Si-specific) subunit beta [Planctomycetota bacterium]